MNEIINGTYALLSDHKPRGGGHSNVRRGVSLRSGEPVALKFIVGRGDEMTDVIFSREVHALETARHPNIVKILDSGIDETQTPFIVMPWIERNLDDWIKAGNIADSNEIVGTLMLPLASALAHLHRRGQEHRDIKPLNILMTESGSPIIADLGISKQAIASISSAGLTLQSWRTPPFAPPEMVDSQPYVRDVYSLAATFVVAMSDSKIENHHELHRELQKLNCSESIRDLLAEALDMDPTERPVDGSLFESLLKEVHNNIVREESTLRKLKLVLSTSAEQQLSADLPEGVNLTTLVSDDLSNRFSARLSAGPDGTAMVELVGDRIRYQCKPKNIEGILLVTLARVEEFETLEWIRRAGFDNDGKYQIGFSASLSSELSNISLAQFVNDLKDHNDNLDSKNSAGALQLHIGKWRRTLDVLVEFERRKRKSITFTSSRQENRDLVISLASSIEEDLVGTEWVLRESKNSPTGSQVEVIRHFNSKITIRRQSGARLLRIKSGFLEPSFGPTFVSIKRQMDAIRKLESPETRVSKLPDILNSSKSAESVPLVEIDTWLQPMDDAKKTVVKAAMSNPDMLLVKGPPGTGKTRLIAEIVAQELRQAPSSRILIVSQTHVAVDNAIQKISELGVDRVVRLGKSNDDRISPDSKDLLLDSQMESWVDESRRKSQAHMAKMADDAGVPLLNIQAAFLLQQVATCLELISRRQELDISILDQEIGLTVESADDPEISNVDIEAQELRRNQLLVEIGENGLLQVGEIDSQGPDSLRTLARGLVAIASNGERLVEVVALHADWLQRMSADVSLAATFLADASVVGGTCLGFLGHSAVRDLEFDLCIMDEASKARTTEALVPVVRSKRTILVGDPNQLPPMNELTADDTDLMDEFAVGTGDLTETLYDVMSDSLSESLIFDLNEQYRMIPPIGDLVSHCFYDSRLKTANFIPDLDISALWPALQWISTSRSKSRFEQSDETSQGSFSNRKEATVISDLVMVLERACETGLVKFNCKKRVVEVLIIAPYRSQLETLRREMAQLKLKHIDISIESIDAVQGKEADITFFSVTRSNSDSNMGFIGRRFWRRINVAVSRGRFGLVVVGDAQFAQTKPGPLKQIMDFMSSNAKSSTIRDCND